MKRSALALVAAAGALLLVALCLPTRLEVRREAQIAASPSVVADFAAEASGWSRWAPWDADAMTLTAQLERGVWWDLSPAGWRAPAKCALLIEAQGGASRVELWVRTGTSGGPFGRFLAGRVRRQLEDQVQQALADLARALAP